MLEKVYDKWNELKKDINFNNKRKVYPKIGEIWYINLGVNIGNESLGKGNYFIRPILIIKEIGNMYFGFSMTTKGKENNKFYLKLNEKYFKKKSFLIISQFRTFDKNRFIKKIGKLSNKDFFEIKNQLKEKIF